MTKVTKMKSLVAVVLVLVMLAPQGLLAAPGANRQDNNLLGHSGVAANGAAAAEVRSGEIIFETDSQQAEDTILKKYSLRVVSRNQQLGYILAVTPPGTDCQQLSARLQNEKGIRFAQPNHIYQLMGRPNDPQLGRQWAIPKIKAEQGWSTVKDPAPVIVAILDTGVDVNHPDLRTRLVPGTNTVNPLKSTRDSDGHGTHVAGIVGAAMNNGIGTAGVAGIPGIKIMPVKVFDQWGGSDTSISDGIIWAADHGAKVINMSFGSNYQSQVLNDAIDYAYGKGVVLVAAAGNWASEEISYPAAMAKVIAVSATNRDGKLAEFSSYGPQIDVAAPGEEIYSTYWDAYKGSTYSELSGTSMASPMVAGLAALLLAKNPKLTVEDVRQIIEASASDMGDPGWDPKFGHGQIDVNKALTLSLSKQDDANGAMERAVNLVSGTHFKERINAGSDVDWYKINLPAKANLQVEVLPAGKVSPGVEIYDSAGAVLASYNSLDRSETDGVPLPFDLAGSKSNLKVAEAIYGIVNDLEQGDYYIKVFGNHFRWSEEDYTITARVLADSDLVKDPYEPNDSYEAAVSAGKGDIRGALSSHDDEDWFKFNLNPGAYKITVKSPAGLDLAVDVESQYNYSEDLEDWDYNKWYSETINNSGQGQDEEGVIVIPPGAGGSYYVRVYDNGGNAVNENYILNITSSRIKADQYEDNNTWQKSVKIESGEEITANFHTVEDEDWYKVSVASSGILKIDLNLPAGIWADLELYSDPEGEAVGRDYFGFSTGLWLGDFGSPDGGQAQRFQEFKVTPGDYYIRVYSYGSVGAEDYRFTTRFETFNFVDPEINDTPSRAMQINTDDSKTGSLYPDQDIDFYVFDVTKAQPYLVYLTPPKDLDTYAVILRGVSSEEDLPAGDQDEYADPGEPAAPDEPELEPLSEINNGSLGQPDTGVFMASKPGRYYIVVAAAPNELKDSPVKSANPYSLVIRPYKEQPDRWENNNTMSQARVINSGISVTPTFMGIEDQDWFKLYVPGPGKLRVSLVVPEDIDGVVEIYDAQGKFIGKADESMVGEEEKAAYSITKPGYYYIKAHDYLGNSSIQPYTLTGQYLETEPPKVSGAKVTGRTVTFNVSEASRVFVKVLNNSDSFVSMILDGAQKSKGKISVAWNGLDATGRKALPGTYKVKIVAIDASGNMSQPVYTKIKI